MTSTLTNLIIQDPAVPMIQLPMKFKSRRTNTATVPQTTPEPYHVDIFDMEGCGCVRHIWFLFAEGRRIEITVDGAETPQVNMPLKPFFGIMHDWTPYFVDNAAYTVMPNYETPGMPGNPGYNLWLPIPFSQSCRIRLYIDAPPDGRTSGLHGSVCTMVDWHEYDDDALLTPFRFHAEHHRYTPAPPRNSAYQMAEVDGTSFMAGIVLGSRQRNYTDMIYHTGGMSILIDGENDPNVIRGTNMEDDFGFSWGFHLHQSRWHGSPYHKWGGRVDQDGVIYRFFGPDPIAFDSSISFCCGSRDDNIETVAYYYRIPGTEAASIVTPDEWLVTGFYENGDDWDAFNCAEDVETIPLDHWVTHFADKEHFIRTVSANRGWLDFRFSGIDPALSAAHFTGRSMYAGSSFDCEKDREAVLRLSYDDWLILWVNGEKVRTLQSEGHFETVRIPLQLRKGRNEFLLKSNNLGHVWNAWVANIAIE
ncbi:DUF2961 domain-containing protein [Chloroflexi bacterium TSY]|nr:DUF2961 domain-containing protein [Chloroflexi bacterium TSY]